MNQRTLEFRALAIAFMLHAAILVFYSIAIAKGPEEIVVSNLKIRFGSPDVSITELADKFSDGQDIDLSKPFSGREVIVAGKTKTPAQPIDGPPVISKKANDMEPASGENYWDTTLDDEKISIPEKPKNSRRQEYAKGQFYGNSTTEGVETVENYAQLLGYFIQEKVRASVPRGFKGKAILNLHIDRKGYVVNYSLKQRTGQPALDNAAIDFARESMSRPFPAVPAGFEPKLKILKYDFTIYYD